MNRLAAAALHATFAATVYWFSPVATSGDSRWTVPTAINLIEHGSASLDPYATLVRASPAGTWEYGPEGDIFARYPVAVSVSAAPFLPPLWALASVMRFIYRRPVASPVLKAFLAGDFVSSYALVELLIASSMMALAAGVQFLIAREFLKPGLASLAAFVFAFATPVWSTASRALWNQTPALLMLSLAVYLLVLARRSEKLIRYSAVPCSIAFMMRPSMAVATLTLTLYVAIHHRRSLAAYVAWAAPSGILFFGYNLAVHHRLLQSYFTDPGAWPYAPWRERFAMQLISPSRGLFIFSPVLLFSLVGMWLAWRRRWLFPLTPYLAFVIGAQVLLVTRFYWPGHCYGPRYFTEIVPLFTIFLIPVFQSWPELPSLARTAFFLLMGWSVFVHLRGATQIAVYQWNTVPNNVDVHQARVWDWHDPQFLRGLL